MTNIADMAKKTNYSGLLLAIRAKLDLTQQQLADRLGVSFASVNRWEGGTKPQKAAKEAIEALAREAGVDESDEGDGAASAVAGRRRRTRPAEPSSIVEAWTSGNGAFS